MKRLLATRAQAAHELTVGRAASKEQESRTSTSSHSSRPQAVETVVQAPKQLVVNEEQRLKLIKRREQMLKEERDDLRQLDKKRQRLLAEIEAIEARKSELQRATSAGMAVSEPALEPQPFSYSSKLPPPLPPV